MHDLPETGKSRQERVNFYQKESHMPVSTFFHQYKFYTGKKNK